MFTPRFFTLLFLLKDLPFPANLASLVSVNSCSNILKSSLDYLPRSVFLSLQLRVGNTPAIIFFSFSSEACLYATFGLAPSELLEFLHKHRTQLQPKGVSFFHATILISTAFAPGISMVSWYERPPLVQPPCERKRIVNYLSMIE